MSFEDTWANADPDAVGGESGKPPAPGEYVVTLKSARAGMSKADNAYAAITFEDLRTQHEWDVLFGFKTQGSANFAKNQFRELGIDVDQVTDLDALDTALKAKAGTYYEVEVVESKNPAYDASTYIRGVAQAGAPPTPESDVPSDVGPEPVAAGGIDTDDVPFLWRPFDGIVEHNHNPFA